MTKTNNVTMRESNDNVDHKKILKKETWISFAGEVKYFS